MLDVYWAAHRVEQKVTVYSQTNELQEQLEGDGRSNGREKKRKNRNSNICIPWQSSGIRFNRGFVTCTALPLVHFLHLFLGKISKRNDRHVTNLFLLLFHCPLVLKMQIKFTRSHVQIITTALSVSNV